jgi:hypothetical protein
MITSARRGSWPKDLDVGPDHAAFGLPIRCYVRTEKIATVCAEDVDRIVGRLPQDLLECALASMDGHLSRPS